MQSMWCLTRLKSIERELFTEYRGMWSNLTLWNSTQPSCSVWMRAEKCEKKHEQPKKTHSDMQSMWETVRSPPAPFRNVSNIIVTPDYFNVMGCVWNRIVYKCFRQLLSCDLNVMYNILKTVNGGSLSHSETLFSIFCIIFCANHNIVQLSYCQYEVELRPLHCGKY